MDRIEVDYPNGGISIVFEREPDYPINPHICTRDISLVQNKLILAQDVIDRTCSADNYFVGIMDWIEVADGHCKYHKRYFGDIGSFSVVSTDSYKYEKWQKEKFLSFSAKNLQYIKAFPLRKSLLEHQKLIYPLFVYHENCFCTDSKFEKRADAKGVEIIDIDQDEYRIVDLHLLCRIIADTDDYVITEVAIYDRTCTDKLDMRVSMHYK